VNIALAPEKLAKFATNRRVAPAMGTLPYASAVALTLLLTGCMQHHEARVQTALLPPPSATPVQHTGRLWVELGDATWETQCRAPKGQRTLCFAGVRRAAFGALERSLWTSFPEVALRNGEPLSPGDYLLKLDVTVDAQAPDPEGPGWSAVAAGGFRLSRDGKLLHEERVGSRSRASFAYGSPLGVGAGEVVDAIAAHVAQVLGAVAEERPLPPTPLPAVVAEVLTSLKPVEPGPTVVPMVPDPAPSVPGPAPSVTPPADADADADVAPAAADPALTPSIAAN
jgi:hypothetical protein